MTQEIRDRYESALDTLRRIVSDTGEYSDVIKTLIRNTASAMLDELERDPDADLEEITDAFRITVERMVMDNMRHAAHAADDEEGESVSDVSLALTFARVDIETPIQRYSDALSQEVKWFVAAGFAYGAIRDYIKDPIGFISAESTKPAKSGNATRQSNARLTLAPVFMDGKRRRSLSEVLGDFRESVPAVGTGNSFKVGSSTWMMLNTTSMTAYNDALAMKWTGRGAVGYYVFRGSDYDCPACDEQCGFIHPLTEMVLPVHPRCLCFCVEAYANETEEDFEI